MTKKRQPVEPFRIKSIEPIKLLNRSDRLKKIESTKYNLFRLDAKDIYIDLLTDSGMTAMSNRQWAALMLGDESYAGSDSFRRFEQTVRELTKKRFIIPCHQGRSAENLMFSTIVKKGQYVLNNTHFDTTRGNTQHKGGIPVDLPCPEADSNEILPFKGNMDIIRLEKFLEDHSTGEVAMVIMTVTNNSIGGQPVSMRNIKETSALCRKHKIRFYFDCARFAENSYFIKRDEPGYSEKTIAEIASEMFSYADGAMMSAKKDGLANTGGFIALDDEELFRQLTELMIIVEGYPTYGGLAGRDLDVLAVGLGEVLEFDYLDYRIEQVRYFGECLKQAGIPIVEPTGGHAVFVDGGQLLEHIPASQFPAQALAIEFYKEGGIRAVEIGSLMFGGIDPNTGQKLTTKRELVRLALPRRVYTNSHLDYVVEVAGKIVSNKKQINGYKITCQSTFLRHFTCELEEVTSTSREMSSSH